jgi:Uma2 family endonuclease
MSREDGRMATQTRSTGSRLAPYRFTVRQFEAMIDAGVFPEGADVELIAGVPVPVAKSEPHNFAQGALGDILQPLTPDGYHYRQDLSARTTRYWRPEPDVAIVRDSRRDYTRQTPNLNRFAVLIEVADTSYGKDGTWKWCRYAASKVPVYGILNLNDRRLEVFTNPVGRGKSARYEVEATYGPNDEVPVIVDGAEVGRFRVGDVLP